MSFRKKKRSNYVMMNMSSDCMKGQRVLDVKAGRWMVP